jgi:phage baseplate assembly protein W
MNSYVYSDIDMDFVESKTDGYTYDKDSVWQALTSLFNTGPGERIFNPAVTLDLQYFLGEPLSVNTAIRIFTFLTQGIPILEPRFLLQTRSCNIVPDYTSYAYYLILVGSILGFSSQTYEYLGQLQR